MDGLTRSSNARARNDAARGSVVLALLGLAGPVAAYLAARRLGDVTIVQATGATCGSAVLRGGAAPARTPRAAKRRADARPRRRRGNRPRGPPVGRDRALHRPQRRDRARG